MGTELLSNYIYRTTSEYRIILCAHCTHHTIVFDLSLSLKGSSLQTSKGFDLIIPQGIIIRKKVTW